MGFLFAGKHFIVSHMQDETPVQRAVRLNKQHQEHNEVMLGRLERLAKERPTELDTKVQGYVINDGGPYGLDTKNAIFGYSPVFDETTGERSSTCKVLVRVVGGFLWLNYRPHDVRMNLRDEWDIKDFHKRHGLLF